MGFLGFFGAWELAPQRESCPLRFPGGPGRMAGEKTQVLVEEIERYEAFLTSEWVLKSLPMPQADRSKSLQW